MTGLTHVESSDADPDVTRMPMPDRLDRLQRRLGFAPLPFVCLLWNFLSSMYPSFSTTHWAFIYSMVVFGLLPVKVSPAAAAFNYIHVFLIRFNSNI